VTLLDPTRAFEKTYDRDGWPFLIVADRDGKVLFADASPGDRTPLEALLDKITAKAPAVESTTAEGIFYMPATLGRSSELKAIKHRDRFPSVACAPDGRVYVAFTTNRAGNDDVFVRVYDGKTWSKDYPIAATAADEHDAVVAVDKSGTVWFSWTSNAGGEKYNIFVASGKDVSKIGAGQRVTEADDDAMHGRIACAADGKVWLTYYKWGYVQGSSRDKEVYVRRFDGKAWSDEIHVSPEDVPSYEDHSDPIVAATDKGAVVAWSWDFHQPKGYTKEAENPTIFIRSIAQDYSLGPARVVSGTHIDTMPALALDGTGRPWCLWESISWDGRAGANRKAICASYDTGNPSEGGALTSGMANVCSPRLVAAPSGKLTAVWAETADGDRWVIKRAEIDPKVDKVPAAEMIVSEGNPRFPAAAYDPKGTLWVAYSAEAGAGREIAVKSFPSSSR